MKYLYAIRTAEEDQGRVKIGISDNSIGRMGALQTGNDSSLTLAAVILTPNDGRDLEALVHAVCREYWLRGEWFRYEGLVVAVVRAMQQCMADDYGHYLLDLLFSHAEGDDVFRWARNARPQIRAV